MKLALLGSLAAVAASAVVANEEVDVMVDESEDAFGSRAMEDDEDVMIAENEDPFSSRAMARSPVPFPILAVLSLMNFINAVQEEWAEEGRDGDNDNGSSKWGWGVWKAVKTVPSVLYETSSMVAPLTLRYMLSDESQHPQCQQKMLCEMNVRIKDRFGKPGEIAMQLASSMAGYALGGTDAQRYDSLVDAARNGRRGKECQELYPKCNARSEGSPVPNLLRLASRLINQ